MIDFDSWWNSAAADSFRAKNDALDGETFRPVWDAAVQSMASHAQLTAAPQAPASALDADGEAFRTAARLGLTLRFHGGCAQSGMPGSPSAYEVVTGADPASSMRQAVRQAAAVIEAGGEPQRLNTGAALDAGVVRDAWAAAANWLRNNYQDHPNIASLCDAMREFGAKGQQ